MPRKTRSKSRNSKSNSDNLKMINEHSHDLNGTRNMDHIDSSSCSLPNETPKKRQAETLDESNDSHSEDVGPPKKKSNNQDNKHFYGKGLKRPINLSDDEDCQLNKAKHAKMENSEKLHKTDFKRRIWKESVFTPPVNSHAQNCPENSPHFVIATYNISFDQTEHFTRNTTECNSVDGNSNDNTIVHLQLLQELEFINADIICLQQVNYKYWKETLECSLKERGYCGDIIIGDKLSNTGVATLYRVARFSKVHIDSNRLSQLCIEQIPSDSGLDEATLTAVKHYLDEPDSYIVTVLKYQQTKTTERLLIVGNTHLSSQATDKLDLRCVQAAGMFWRIHGMISQVCSPWRLCPTSLIGPVCPAHQIKSDLSNNNRVNDNKINNNNNNNINNSDDNDGPAPLSSSSPPPPPPCWILCGDFNSNIDSPVYQICRDGYPDEQSITELQSLRRVPIGSTEDGDKKKPQSSSLVDLLWHSFQHPLTDSVSSYLKVTSYEPCRDYIWMSDRGLQPNRVLMPCSSEYANSAAVVAATTAARINNNSCSGTSRLLPSAATDLHRRYNHTMSLACDVAFMT